MTEKKKPVEKKDAEPAEKKAEPTIPPEIEKILKDTQRALYALSIASNIGKITEWEFNRARAHRPNAACVSSLITRLAAVLGTYVPTVNEEGIRGTRGRRGVKYIQKDT